MARLFTAVELSADARSAIVISQSKIARSLRAVGFSGLRLVRPEQLHLTLFFLGEVHASRVPTIVDAMASSIPVHPFDLAVASCGVFPQHGPARVLWLGVARGGRELGQVFDIVAARLEAVGVPREHRPFTPHLTIGRWHGRGEPGVRARLPQPGDVVVDAVSAVTLFESRLQSGGAEHVPLVRAPLVSVH
jgi:RNA 2',3'-cyclic 3'-phosphodiesterase